jgi:hypothetical protein
MPEETIRSASVATIPTFGNELKVLSLEMQMVNNRDFFWLYVAELFPRNKKRENIFTIKFKNFKVKFQAQKKSKIFIDF